MDTAKAERAALWAEFDAARERKRTIAEAGLRLAAKVLASGGHPYADAEFRRLTMEYALAEAVYDDVRSRVTAACEKAGVLF